MHLRYGDLGRLRRLTSSGAVATLVVCAGRPLALYILVRVSFQGLQLEPSVHLTALGFQSRLVGYAHLGWGPGPKHRKPMHILLQGPGLEQDHGVHVHKVRCLVLLPSLLAQDEAWRGHTAVVASLVHERLKKTWEQSDQIPFNSSTPNNLQKYPIELP